MDYRMVIALNMFDELEQSGGKIDYQHLGNMIGVPIVPTVSRSGKGVNQLFDTVIDVYEGRNEAVRHVHVNLGNVIENGITPLKNLLKQDPTCTREFSPRYLAIKTARRRCRGEEDSGGGRLLSRTDEAARPGGERD